MSTGIGASVRTLLSDAGIGCWTLVQRIGILAQFIRTKVETASLDRLIYSEFLRLGKRQLSNGTAEADLAMRIQQVHEQLDSMGNDATRRKQLNDERRRLTVQIGEIYLTRTSESNDVEGGTRAVRQLLAKKEANSEELAVIVRVLTTFTSQDRRQILVFASLLSAVCISIFALTNWRSPTPAEPSRSNVHPPIAMDQTEKSATREEQSAVRSASFTPDSESAAAANSPGTPSYEKSKSEKGKLTRAYLNDVHSRFVSFTSDFQKDFKITRESTDLDELRKANEALSRHCGNGALELRRLSTIGVDRRLSEWTMDRAAFLDKGRVHFSAFAAHLAEIQQVQAYYSSEGSLLESFVRGADGDPFGTTRDAIAQKHRLQQEFIALRKAEAALANDEAILTAALQKVRLYLIDEYPEVSQSAK